MQYIFKNLNLYLAFIMYIETKFNEPKVTAMIVL